MCAGANSNAARINRIDLLITPLIKKTVDGMKPRPLRLPSRRLMRRR